MSLQDSRSGNGLRRRLTSKIGRCSRCITLSIRLAIALIVLGVVLYSLEVRGLAFAAALSAAALASVLALAHVSVYSLRVTPCLVRAEVRTQDHLARRRFLGTAAQVGLALVTVSLLGRVSAAQAPLLCRGKHTGLKLAVSGLPQDKTRDALESLKAAADLASIQYCQQFKDCAPPSVCHRSRRPSVQDLQPITWAKVGKQYVASGTLDTVSCACN